MKKKTLLSVGVSSALIAGGLTFGAITTTAIADAGSSYSYNEQGQSYGSAVAPDRPEKEPDLIQAEASNGRIGYVFASDLMGYTPKSPEEAAMANEINARNNVIPVYESDGKTKIGEITLVPSENTLADAPDK